MSDESPMDLDELRQGLEKDRETLEQQRVALLSEIARDNPDLRDMAGRIRLIDSILEKTAPPPK